MQGFMKKSEKNSKKRLKIIRVTTVSESMYIFCRDIMAELSDDYEMVAVSSPGVDFDRLLAENKFRCIPVPMERHISPLKDFVSLARLISVFHKEHPQVVHSMTPKAGLLSMIAAWITRVPIRVHTFTGLVFPTSVGLQKKILILTDRITCACASHIIPEGEGVKNDLIRYGITRKPIQVLGYGNVRGIDLKHYARTSDVMKAASDIRKKLHIPSSAFVFIFVGRLVGDKGINELVEAFRRLSLKYEFVHLLLVGREEPQLDPLLDSMRSEMSRNSHIYAVGEQTDVRPWYALADALVFPSHREGFPNVVIEAGAMELPSIVTDINGSREIIRQNENGTIIPVKDIEALYEAMQNYICHPDAVKKMSENARPLIASRYEKSFVKQCLKNFYQSLLTAK